MATVEAQEEGTFKDPTKEETQDKSLKAVVKEAKNVKKIQKDNGKAKATEAEPKPEPVDWKAEYFNLKDSMEATCLNLQIALRNQATKLTAKEKGLKVQEQPMG